MTADQVESLKRMLDAHNDGVVKRLEKLEQKQLDVSENQAVFLDRTDRLMDNVEKMVPQVAELAKGVHSIELTITNSVFPEITASKEKSREAMTDAALAKEKAETALETVSNISVKGAAGGFWASPNGKIALQIGFILAVGIVFAMGVNVLEFGAAEAAGIGE